MEKMMVNKTKYATELWEEVNVLCKQKRGKKLKLDPDSRWIIKHQLNKHNYPAKNPSLHLCLSTYKPPCYVQSDKKPKAFVPSEGSVMSVLLQGIYHGHNRTYRAIFSTQSSHHLEMKRDGEEFSFQSLHTLLSPYSMTLWRQCTLLLLLLLVLLPPTLYGTLRLFWQDSITLRVFNTFAESLPLFAQVRTSSSPWPQKTRPHLIPLQPTEVRPGLNTTNLLSWRFSRLGQEG